MTPTRTSPADATPADGSPVRRWWPSWRGPLLVALLVLTTAVLLGLTGGAGSQTPLDPHGYDPDGSAAAATLLREQGVRVDVAHRPEDVRGAGPDTTVLVADSSELDRAGREALVGARADVVLVAPSTPALDALAPGLSRAPAAGLVATAAGTSTSPPGCALPAAASAGPLSLGGDAYRLPPGPPPPGAVTCYGSDGTFGLVRVPAPGGAGAPVPAPARSVTVLGDGSPLRNGSLTDHGNAALTLDLLGSHGHLLWYLPVPAPGPGGQRSLIELVPPGVIWAAVVLLGAAVITALWRGRRLGPLVPERLPVVVRASETAEGRARLYHRAGARARAAAVLRARATRRLARRHGLAPVGTVGSPLVARVAERVGRSPVAVAELLDGPSPTDDAALVGLAHDLDALVDAATDPGAPHPSTAGPEVPR